MSNFFDKLFSKKKDKNQKLDKLYEVPKKDKGLNAPHFPDIEQNIIHQADILFLPNDDGYKFALVVTDVGTAITDAEPLKTKSSEEVLKALKKIYKGKYLEKPKLLTVDSGTEFKGEVEKWIRDKGIGYKVAKTGRHRQLAMVERRNQIIGKALFKRMTAEEMLTGQESKHWVDDLPDLLKAMNGRTEKENRKKKKKVPEKILCEGDSCDLLPIGTKVRVALEFPVDNVRGTKLHGKFRSTDIRFDTQVRTVEQILLKPKAPPLYLLSKVAGEPPVGYTKNQLQVVRRNEKLPNPKQVIRNKKPETYIVDKIVGKKKIKGKIFYKVRWEGFSSDGDTWEPSAELKKNPVIRELITEYEK